MQIKVRATASSRISNITKGRIYLCRTGDRKLGSITANNGETRTIYIPSCAHLNGNPWEIISEEVEA